MQDEVTAVMKGTHPAEHIDAKMIGVFYHSNFLRGRYVHMVHAKNEVVQELVGSTLPHYKVLASVGS
jgi:hypothetical protein